MAWNGTNFLVVWAGLSLGHHRDIYGARVSGAGSVLDPAGIPVSTAANDQSRRRWPGTAPTSWWCGRTSARAPRDIYGARVSGAGSVLDPAGIPISTAANNQTTPAVAWNGTDFLVVWQDRRSGTRQSTSTGRG